MHHGQVGTKLSEPILKQSRGNNSSRGTSRGGSGARGGGNSGRGGAGGAKSEDKPKREAILDLSKYLDKRIRVKFTGGREGTLPL